MPPAIPTSPLALGTPSAPIPADPSLWDRIATWVSEHKAVVYTIAGVAVVVTTAGAVYYVRSGPPQVSSPFLFPPWLRLSGCPIALRPGARDHGHPSPANMHPLPAPRRQRPGPARRRGGNGSKPRGTPKLGNPPPTSPSRPAPPRPPRSNPPTTSPRSTRPPCWSTPRTSASSSPRS